MKITIFYNLARLSDRAINALLSGCEAGSGVKTTLVEQINDMLIAELLARTAGRPWPVTDRHVVEAGFDVADHSAITAAFENATDGVLFFGVQAQAAAEPLREDFENCADFLKATAAAIRDLLVRYQVA